VGASLATACSVRSGGRTLESMNVKSKLVVIVGSVREGRSGPVVASWIAEQAREHSGFDVEVIDLADTEIPLSLPAVPPKFAGDDYPRPDGMKAVTAHLDDADAFIIVTPDYNHSYPASLKAVIDWHFTHWTAKPVAFVNYAGMAGGRDAVLHLENVLTELHAATIRDGLAFPNYFIAWEDGAPLDSGTASYAKIVLDQLDWWANALRPPPIRLQRLPRNRRHHVQGTHHSDALTLRPAGTHCQCTDSVSVRDPI